MLYETIYMRCLEQAFLRDKKVDSVVAKGWEKE